MSLNTSIIVKTIIQLPCDEVWRVWNNPEDIKKWHVATDSWHTPKAINDLKIGGKFSFRMETKDGSFGFDFNGTYLEIIPHKLIIYELEDGRKTEISFIANGNKTEITEIFEAEMSSSLEQQKEGWQAILNNFKSYIEKIVT